MIDPKTVTPGAAVRVRPVVVSAVHGGSTETLAGAPGFAFGAAMLLAWLVGKL